MTLSEFDDLPDGTKVYSGDRMGTVRISPLGTYIAWAVGITLIKTERDVQDVKVKND
jgi:hypothetical protein